jgi:DNA-binding response OmpR family regulator
MSGGFGSSFLAMAQQLGADAALYKPFSAEEIRAVVERVLTVEPVGSFQI